MPLQPPTTQREPGRASLLPLCLILGLLTFLTALPAHAWPGDLTLAWSAPKVEKTNSVAWGDWDNDGDPDLAVGNDGQPNCVYRNDGDSLTLAWSASISDSTRSLAWGDWDGDGDLDLAVGNYGQPNRVYRNAGNTLTLAWSAPVTDNTTSVAWGDWDGDGDLDLVVGNAFRPTRVYQNEGETLILAWSSVETNNTTSVAWGDWDGDGNLDLAVGNYGAPNRVYRNTGGTLTLVWSAPVNDNTNSIAWGDWDDDGKLDLAAGNYGQPVRVYRNHSDGLSLAWSAPISDSTASVAWGDWDGDGDLDLAIGNFGPNRIYRNDCTAPCPDGGFLTLAWVSPESDRTTSVAWADWDGDGDPDLAAGNDGKPARIYSNGNTHLTPAWTAPESAYSSSLAWGDWDGDGDLDLAVGNYGQPNRLYRNDNGDLTLAWSAAQIDNTTSVAWGDWDGDGDLDLAVGNESGANRIYRNDCVASCQDGGTFTLAWSSSRVERTTSVAWGDWDGDGDLDLAVGNAGYANRLYRNDSGRLTLAWSAPITDNTRSLAWGDWDGDGDLDLAVGNAGQPNRVYGNDNGILTPAWSAPVTDNTTSLAWGDWDGDGNPDLAVGNDGKANRLYRNAGGTLSLAWSAPITESTRSLAWGDWDGDGDLDLAAGNYGQANRVYRNDGGRLTPAWSAPETDYTTSLTWGDWDGDGDLDLAAGSIANNHVYRNDSATLSLVWASPNAERAASLAWGDWDGDGDLDLAVGNDGQPDRLYSNDGGRLVLTWSSPQRDNSRSLAWGDWDGDGDLDLAAGNQNQPNRVYRNEGSTLTLAWSAPLTDNTTSLAWGDWDGDGDLDLAAGNQNQPNRVYRNDGGALTLAWSAPISDSTRSLAWGDWDGDGDLDLAVGNQDQPNRVYRNAGGTLALAWSAPLTENTRSLAWGDWDGDGDLDLAVGNIGVNRLYRNEGGRLTPAWVSPEAGSSSSVAWGDWDNDGDLDLAVGNQAEPARVYRNDGGRLTLVWSAPEVDNTLSVAWGDYDGDGDLDLATAGYHQTTGAPKLIRLYRNRAADSRRLWDTTVRIASPDPAVAAFFFSARIFAGPTLPITYTLFDPAGNPIRYVQAYYSLDGGSQWRPAVATRDTVTTNLATGPLTSLGVTHVYTWDIDHSDLFGASDQVVVRLDAYTGFTGPGPYQFPFYRAVSPPLRARGNQVRVIRETLPAADALVYRLPAGQAGVAEPMSDNAGQPFRTNPAGYLAGRGELHPGDQLVALLPITSTRVYTLYHTSAAPTTTGLDAYTVSAPGVQTLTVSADNPLLLFNLDVTLEWDARNDGTFRQELETAIRQASAVLYDVSDGQIAIGQVQLHQSRANWVASDVVIYAQNGIRPRASMGGVVDQLTSDVVSATLTITNAYGPGQVRLGPNWDPFGQSLVELSQDWQRALAHELAHYLLFLPDDYLGMDEAGRPISTDCQGSFMTSTYDDAYSEFLTRAGWTGDCLKTIAQHTTGRTDWETLQHFYAMLRVPAVTNPGPGALPLAVTRLRWNDPTEPAPTLPASFFDLRDAATRDLLAVRKAQGYLFKTRKTSDPGDDGVFSLGATVGSGDRIKVRGAEPGDRLCLFGPYDETRQSAYLGCIESLTDRDRSVLLSPVSDWQPNLIVTAITSRTLAITVTLPVSITALNVQVFPTYGTTTRTLPVRSPWAAMTTPDPANPITFTQMITLDDPSFEGFVRVWVPNSDPQREAISQVFLSPPWGPNSSPIDFGGNSRAWGANSRQLGAPVASGDGQVTIFNLQDLFADTGTVSLQALSHLPRLPLWLTPVGQGYRLVSNQPFPRVIAFDYLQRDVPAGYEHTLRLYYSPDEGETWQRLPTDLDRAHNRATALLPDNAANGQGIYALLSTVEMPALQAGWNLFSYPLPGARPLPQALASVAGAYTAVYFYEPATNRWRLHDATVLSAHPEYAGLVNDLSELTFGRSYWLYATQAITPYLGVPGEGESRVTINTLSQPPATFYGPVLPGAELTPAAGMRIRATINGIVCGEGQIEEWLGQWAYKVQVAADTGDSCGAPGRWVQLWVNGRRLLFDSHLWDNRQAWYHPLGRAGLFQLYLPWLIQL